MKKIEDWYLGDGVWVSFDGYHIILDLRAQDTTTKIALEPPVMDALFEFRKYIANAGKIDKMEKVFEV